MKSLFAAVAALALALPVAARAGSWENVSLVDHMCLSKMKEHPDDHPTSCLLKCAGSGYGILTADGKWLKLDKAGNDKALTALKATSRKDHVRANVTGNQVGDTIQVASLAIPD